MSRLYALAAWKAKPHGLRWRTLVRDGFRCRMCGALGKADASDLVADHIKPHRGDVAAFMDPANVQTLCLGCHGRFKQSQERGGNKRIIGADGWPVG